METHKPSESTASVNRSISRSAFKVSFGGLLSLIVGLVSQMILAALFGTGAEVDAYLTAMGVPLYLEAVLLTGIPVVLIPAFVREQEAGREGAAWALAGTFFWLSAGVLTAVALVGAAFAPSIVALTAPGLNPAKAELTAQMLAVLMFSVPLTGLGTLTQGVQNARNRFFWPAVAAGLGSAGNAVALLVLYPLVGPMSLAWSYLVMVALRSGVTIVPVLRRGWKGLMPLHDARLRELLWLMMPIILFGLINRSVQLFMRFFASGLPDGDLSYIGFAARVAKIATSLLGAGIATVILPAMARAFVQDGKAGLVERLEHGWRLTLAVALPAWAVMSGAAVPLVAVLFERRAWTADDTLNVARVLSIVVLGAVVLPMVGELLVRAFYVTKDTRTVPIVAAVTTVLYVPMARLLTETGGYVGLALAEPAYRLVGLVVLVVLLQRKLKSIRAGKALKEVALYGLASGMAFIAAWVVSTGLVFLPDIIQLVLAFGVAGALYMGILYGLDRDTAISILEITGAERLISAGRRGIRRLSHTVPQVLARYAGGRYRVDAGTRPEPISPLLMVALAVDLLTPYLIWRGILPAPFRWFSHAALALTLALAYVRMMVHDRVPLVVPAMAGITAIGAAVAILQGQGMVATAWGVWILLQYPLIGLYVYLQPSWPEQFPKLLRIFCVTILGLELLAQLAQYVGGEPPGDHLAGTFGAHGTGNLVILVLFILCLALGQGLGSGRWRTTLLVLALGSVSSVLGEMKFFPFAVVALLLLAMIVVTLRAGQLWRFLPYAVLLGLFLYGFVLAYDAVVAGPLGTAPLRTYLDPEYLNAYLNISRSYLSGQVYQADLGRNFAVTYAWESIQEDPVTFLFGMGIGARGESRTLGTTGIGLRQSNIGLATGTSLMVMIQELGLVGILALGAFFLWLIVRLVRDLRGYSYSVTTDLRYGVLLFTVMWPMWLWYSTVWTMRVPMLLYWVALGYVMRDPAKEPRTIEQPELRSRSMQSVFQ